MRRSVNETRGCRAEIREWITPLCRQTLPRPRVEARIHGQGNHLLGNAGLEVEVVLFDRREESDLVGFPRALVHWGKYCSARQGLGSDARRRIIGLGLCAGMCLVC